MIRFRLILSNPGEAPPEKTAAAEETTALEKTEESERKTISNHEN